MGEPVASHYWVIRSVGGRSANWLRSRGRGQANTGRKLRVDTLIATGPGGRRLFADQYVFARETSTQTAFIVFTVEFRVRNSCDLAANEERAKYDNCHGWRQPTSTESAANLAHAGELWGFI